eukprot:19358-Heterococcus_DN1.PRE.1
MASMQSSNGIHDDFYRRRVHERLVVTAISIPAQCLRAQRTTAEYWHHSQLSERLCAGGGEFRNSAVLQEGTGDRWHSKRRCASAGRPP